MVHEFTAMLGTPDISVTAIEGAAHMVKWNTPDAWATALITIKTRVLGAR